MLSHTIAAAAAPRARCTLHLPLVGHGVVAPRGAAHHARVAAPCRGRLGRRLPPLRRARGCRRAAESPQYESSGHAPRQHWAGGLCPLAKARKFLEPKWLRTPRYVTA
mmetsp:Transcript_11907/g.9591  ORF Transcript_11907/g.9591 Transcript_11907/m.9591 type:complete len:108 (+) Transcript_11907:87-410(+)